MRVVFITGLSGGGKSTALRALEDLGFYCVDNLPIPLITEFVDLLMNLTNPPENVAIVVDIREGEFLETFGEVHKNLKRKGLKVEILFLDAREDVIKRRYSETRRRHPLGDIESGIKEERRRLAYFTQFATKVIDTTYLTVHELRDMVTKLYGSGRVFYINIVAFGFKYGLPENADLVFDVRFLPNPHFVQELRPLTGRDIAVREFVLGKKITQIFLRKISTFLKFVIPQYRKEGKVYLTIAFGCTGGKHRSVVIADEVYTILSKDYKDIRIVYRDMHRE